MYHNTPDGDPQAPRLLIPVHIARTIAELRCALSPSRPTTLVPTMGNLHEGHLSLVRLARAREGLVVASMCVNRLQFAPHEDFATYPRTPDRDYEMLAAGGCDLVFAPGEEEVFPQPQEFMVSPPSRLAGMLEGAVRPRFFTGVCTIVLKLFNLVRPTAAVFGKKDYQQLLVIREMVGQFALPIELLPAATVREPSGLALSSRNAYLGKSEQVEAARLHVVLEQIANSVRSGRTDLSTLEAQAAGSLAGHGWKPDYIAIRRRRDLAAPSAGDSDPLIVLGAAALAGTRLIDNVEIPQEQTTGRR